jgi:2-amino-4-hydroxy-6-hydroxymethyldihydropteridine diphosphokinase
VAESRSTTAYVGLGSNLDDPEAQVRLGMHALGNLSDTRVVVCSSLYRSAPVGAVDQPDFVNAVCQVETGLSPDALLAALLEVEAAHGRTREIHHGPRTLDLDLLLYGDRIIHNPALTVPHPRLHERAFVLYPLSEIAPDLNIPGRGSAVQLLAGCHDQCVYRFTGP